MRRLAFSILILVSLSGCDDRSLPSGGNDAGPSGGVVCGLHQQLVTDDAWSETLGFGVSGDTLVYPRYVDGVVSVTVMPTTGGTKRGLSINCNTTVVSASEDLAFFQCLDSHTAFVQHLSNGQGVVSGNGDPTWFGSAAQDGNGAFFGTQSMGLFEAGEFNPTGATYPTAFPADAYVVGAMAAGYVAAASFGGGAWVYDLSSSSFSSYPQISGIVIQGDDELLLGTMGSDSVALTSFGVNGIVSAGSVPLGDGSPMQFAADSQYFYTVDPSNAELSVIPRDGGATTTCTLPDPSTAAMNATAGALYVLGYIANDPSNVGRLWRLTR
jgi:hypothetical protein